MREIKFRAWYGSEIGMKDPEFNGSINEIFAEKNGEYMQYTGLKDKQDQEIYEGDILQAANNENGFYEVVWHDDGFKKVFYFIRKYEGHEWPEKTYLPIHPKSFMVVGNIYENPELLEDKYVK